MHVHWNYVSASWINHFFRLHKPVMRVKFSLIVIHLYALSNDYIVACTSWVWGCNLKLPRLFQCVCKLDSHTLLTPVNMKAGSLFRYFTGNFISLSPYLICWNVYEFTSGQRPNTGPDEDNDCQLQRGPWLTEPNWLGSGWLGEAAILSNL